MPLEATFAGHWLTIATNASLDHVCDKMGGGFSRLDTIGGFNQPYSSCHESGARVYYGSQRRDQPIVVNLPGEVCEHWFDQGVKWATTLNAWITRIDAACDVHPPDLARRRMLDMRREWKSKRVATALKRFSEVRSDPPEGWTQYYGSSQSRLRTRAYDRRGPLRIEKQWRPERELGSYVPEMVARRGVAPLWRSLSTDLDFKRLTWYQQLLAGDQLELPQHVKPDSTWDKLIDQLRLQYGPTLWALQLAGFDLSALAVEPDAPIHGQFAATWLRRADDAEKAGYNVDKLRQEIRCKLK